MAAKIQHRSPPPGCVDSEILVLTRNGLWLADGEEITHEPTRRLFSRSLKQDEGGWFIHIGNETKYVQVEDTAFFVQRLSGTPETGFELDLSDETHERLDFKSLRYQPGRLTCRLHDREETCGAPEAKFLPVAYRDLLQHLEEDPEGYFLTLEGCRVQLGLSVTNTTARTTPSKEDPS
jgi:hypothetical protein